MAISRLNVRGGINVGKFGQIVADFQNYLRFVLYKKMAGKNHLIGEKQQDFKSSKNG